MHEKDPIRRSLIISLIDALDINAIITIHQEPFEAHEESHDILDEANRNKDSMNLFSLTDL